MISHRAWLGLAASAAVATGLLGWLGAPRERTIRPDAFGAALVYRGFSAYRAEGSSRGGLDRSATLVLEGLWPSVPATVSVELSSSDPRPVRVLANAQRVARAHTDLSPLRVAFEQPPDANGMVQIQFDRGWGARETARPSYVRVGRVFVLQVGAPRHPWWRLGLYALLGLLVNAFAASLLTPRKAFATTLVAVLGLTVLMARMPLQAAALLPWFALAPLAALAWLWGARGLRTLSGFDDASARWLAFGLLLRLGFALGFEGADFGFHLHNVWRFRAGAVLTSVAPGASGRLAVPYPPALYAILAPLPTAWDEWALRIAMGLIECAQPLLLWALIRRVRCEDRVAALAAATLALMPEGILVLAKGIAANTLGNATTVAALLAIAARAHPAVVVGLLALGLLAHFGAAMTLFALVAALGLLEARDGGFRALCARWGGLALAGVIAIAAYYHAVLPVVWGAVTDVAHGLTAGSDGFRFHPIRIGKIVQDLLLKFGGWVFILPFAYGGLRTPCTRLLRPWLLVGLGVGAMVVFTPVVLRFEYFLLPPVAWAAAIGTMELERRGRGWIATGLRVFSCAVQIALVVGLATGRFDIINVVMESPRWPLVR